MKYNALIHPGCSRIPRSWDEGFCDPDWRHQQVQEYVDAANGSHPHAAYVLDLVAKETDENIKQLLALRQHGKCERQEVYEWAWQRFSENKIAGHGSLIKAFALAKCSAEQIASHLNTSVERIAAFLALFWDIERYRLIRPFLNSLFFPFGGRRKNDAEAVREGLLFTAVRYQEFAGIERLLTPDIGLTKREWKETRQQIERLTAYGQFEGAFKSVVGLPHPETDIDRYIGKLRCLMFLPPRRVEGQRGERFEKALRAIADGAPLSDFL